MVAARIGSAEFFEPLALTSPFKRCPPSMMSFESHGISPALIVGDETYSRYRRGLERN